MEHEKAGMKTMSDVVVVLGKREGVEVLELDLSLSLCLVQVESCFGAKEHQHFHSPEAHYASRIVNMRSYEWGDMHVFSIFVDTSLYR